MACYKLAGVNCNYTFLQKQKYEISSERKIMKNTYKSAYLKRGRNSAKVILLYLALGCRDVLVSI